MSADTGASDGTACSSALDLSTVAAEATAAARDFVGSRFKADALDRLGEDHEVAECFVYHWIKTLATKLATLEKGLERVCLLPTTEDGDCLVHDIIVLAKTRSAALDLLSTSIEQQFDKVRQAMGLPCVIKVRIMSQEDLKRGRSMLDSLHAPALQVWP